MSSSSCPLSEKCTDQSFGLCRCFSLSSHHSGIGSLSEFRGQASATSQDTVHAFGCVQRPTRPGSTASTSTAGTPEAEHFLPQRYLVFLPCSLTKKLKESYCSIIKTAPLTVLSFSLHFTARPKSKQQKTEVGGRQDALCGALPHCLFSPD